MLLVITIKPYNITWVLDTYKTPYLKYAAHLVQNSRGHGSHYPLGDGQKLAFFVMDPYLLKYSVSPHKN